MNRIKQYRQGDPLSISVTDNINGKALRIAVESFLIFQMLGLAGNSIACALNPFSKSLKMHPKYEHWSFCDQR